MNFDSDGFPDYYKCALNVMGTAVGDGDLKPRYEKLKQDVEDVVKNDCCSLYTLQKVTKLFGGFMYTFKVTKSHLTKTIFNLTAFL